MKYLFVITVLLLSSCATHDTRDLADEMLWEAKVELKKLNMGVVGRMRPGEVIIRKIQLQKFITKLEKAKREQR